MFLNITRNNTDVHELFSVRGLYSLHVQVFNPSHQQFM